MKVATRGRVTIPRHIRHEPGTEVVWEMRDGVAALRKAEGSRCSGRALVEMMRGPATVKTSTDEIMVLMRG